MSPAVWENLNQGRAGGGGRTIEPPQSCENQVFDWTALGFSSKHTATLLPGTEIWGGGVIIGPSGLLPVLEQASLLG